MALIEITRDSVEITWEQSFYVTTKELVIKNGNAIAEKDVAWFTYTPVTPIEEIPEKFRGIAESLWTPEIIKEYIDRHPAEPEQAEPDPA